MRGSDESLSLRPMTHCIGTPSGKASLGGGVVCEAGGNGSTRTAVITQDRMTRETVNDRTADPLPIQ